MMVFQMVLGHSDRVHLVDQFLEGFANLYNVGNIYSR